MKKNQKHGHFKTWRHPPGVAGVTRVPNVYLCNTCKFTRVRDTDDKKRQKHENFKTQRSPTGPAPRVAGVSSWHQEQKQKRDHFKTPAIIVVTLYLLLVCVGVVMYSGEYDVCECASTVARQTFQLAQCVCTLRVTSQTSLYLLLLICLPVAIVEPTTWPPTCRNDLAWNICHGYKTLLLY